MKRKIWIMLAVVAVVTLMIPTLAFAHGHYYSQDNAESAWQNVQPAHHDRQYSYTNERSWCNGYEDSDGNGYCDVCGNLPAYCRGYSDLNENGICDHCEHHDGTFTDTYGHHGSTNHHDYSDRHYGHHGCCR